MSYKENGRHTKLSLFLLELHHGKPPFDPFNETLIKSTFALFYGETKLFEHTHAILHKLEAVGPIPTACTSVKASVRVIIYGLWLWVTIESDLGGIKP